MHFSFVKKLVLLPNCIGSHLELGQCLLRTVYAVRRSSACLEETKENKQQTATWLCQSIQSECKMERGCESVLNVQPVSLPRQPVVNLELSISYQILESCITNPSLHLYISWSKHWELQGQVLMQEWGCLTWDCVGIWSSLGDCSLWRVVGGIVVQVGDSSNERIWVASIRHSHLFARHELQTAYIQKLELNQNSIYIRKRNEYNMLCSIQVYKLTHSNNSVVDMLLLKSDQLIQQTSCNVQSSIADCIALRENHLSDQGWDQVMKKHGNVLETCFVSQFVSDNLYLCRCEIIYYLFNIQ